MQPIESVHGGTPAIDMRQFFEIFYTEASEHLAAMESLLLAIDSADPGGEALNAIFRAAHSIKGASATFGFEDMAGLTHEAETLLDQVRKGELSLTVPMVDALLEAGDVLRAQLARHRGETGAQIDAGPVVANLLAFSRGTAPAQTAASSPARGFALHFVMTAQASYDALIAELARVGDITTLAGPDANNRCEIGIETRAALPEIAAILAVAVVPGSARVEPCATPEVAPADDPGFGLFSDAPVTTPAPDPGFGFFDGEPAQPDWGRRATDHPDIAVAPAGRRTHEKPVVAAGGDTTSIRVGLDKVDHLINLVGELVITQAMLARKAGKIEAAGDASLSAGMSDLERNTRDLQAAVMSIRMLPASFVFNRIPRMLRDLAARLGKQIELKTVGEQTELDKGVIERITDPINHLVRNSIDHGIEAPEERVAAGKPAQGTLSLRASHQGGNIVIEVSDDGRGLDRGRILAKADECGLRASPLMSDQEVWQLIFEPGFSTAEKLTEVSGRGVGMDVVKRNIRALGGSVEVDSVKGQGTRVTVRLPLTLAIMDGMSVGVCGETYVIPLSSVVELLQPGSRAVRTVSGQGRVVEVRSEYLPVVSLPDLFGGHGPGACESEAIIVIVEVEGVRTALLVDALIGQHQVVVKSIEANYRRVPGISGATIMSDGTVALIMDIATLVKLARH